MFGVIKKVAPVANFPTVREDFEIHGCRLDREALGAPEWQVFFEEDKFPNCLPIKA